jgi:hypothetical protein
MAQRGRPTLEIKETPTKFTREFVDNEGVKSIWKYDLNITTTGPISVEQVYPKTWKSWEELNNALPITKRMFLNEQTGGLVSYGRAKQLGII